MESFAFSLFNLTYGFVASAVSAGYEERVHLTTNENLDLWARGLLVRVQGPNLRAKGFSRIGLPVTLWPAGGIV